MTVNITQIEENITQLVNGLNNQKINQGDFIYELLLAYGHRKQSVSRLRSGERNLAKVDNEVVWKRHLYFRHETSDQLHSEIDRMKREPRTTRDKLRFVIVTNFRQLLAIDTKTGDSLDIEFSILAKHFDFFLPWAGMEKALYRGENPADVKAAEKMAKLFDQIKADNAIELGANDEVAHQFNIFLTRLLFCFFAEDTNIFEKGQFSYAIESHSKADGSDLNEYLNRLFKVLNEAEAKRGSLPDYLAKFPYVNGGLFAKAMPSPTFSSKSRKLLIECGSELDWSDINPDIFGSMIQAVAHSEKRGSLGMHYTSVTNIMKVIEPLFLNELYEELEYIETDIAPNLKVGRLRKLHERIKKMKIFDPACGSGNFLIIAFKELRRLEMEIIKRIDELSSNNDDWLVKSGVSEIKLSQFHGIELDDFAHEVAILSLWLTEHQMNVEFKAEFGSCAPSLPLKDAGHIVCGNATRLDWEEVCAKDEGCEVFILGNPPYLGARNQSKTQKSDMKKLLGHIKGFNNIDYIACWFFSAAEYIKDLASSRFSFVSTNSIAQGTQVAILWPHILKTLEIGFSYKSFKWMNHAKSNAGVTCVIIGVRNKSDKDKFLFTSTTKSLVNNINAYLLESGSIYIRNRTKQISNLSPINYGSFALDDGNYTLSPSDKDTILNDNPESEAFIKKFIGAKELIQGAERYCLWIEDSDLSTAKNIPLIKNRMDKVLEWRKNSNRANTVKLASTPHRFAEIRQPIDSYIAFPTVSSERRKYIPIDFLEPQVIASNQVYVIPKSPAYLFSIISSRMHMTWVRTVAGRLKTDYRYSSALCYNTFPFPPITDKQKQTLEDHVINVLSERENHPEKTMAQLYDPDKMPDGLRQAHHDMDMAVEQCYRKKPFTSDEERLEYLFTLYEEMTAAEGKKHA